MKKIDCNLVNCPSNLTEMIKKQLEFYLDDANLYKDKFLQNLL